MKKRTNRPIQKHQESHYLEAKTTHKNNSEIELASEFFNDDLIRPLDTDDIFSDQLIDQLKKDSKN